MRGVRSFIVLLVIAIPLAWYAWRESKREPTEDKKAQEKVFAGIDADKIDRLTVVSDKGDQTTAEKKNGKWELTQPAATAGDEAELSGITSNLASLEVQRVVDDQPSDVKQYGLDPPRIKLSFRANGKEHQLLVGQKTPTASDLYARVADKPRVFLIPSYLDTTLNRGTFDLRDKTVLKFDRDKIDHVLLETPDHVTNLSKLGADWRITSPIDARADFGTVEGIIGRLNTAQMKSLVDSTGKDPKEYGLDKPAVTVKLSSGSSQASLALGKSAGEGVVYARDLSRPLVFTVESGLLDDVKKEPGDYRMKDLFDARAFNTSRVEVTRGGQTTTFEKQGDKWKQLSPSAKDADASKVEGLVTALSNVRATSFVDKTTGTGLDAPDVTISLKFDENKLERVKLTKHGSDAYAQREGDAGAAKIDPTSLDTIIKALDALK
jgi:hypothetical protein